MKLVITIKEGDFEFELTTAEARKLYAELKELFEPQPPQSIQQAFDNARKLHDERNIAVPPIVGSVNVPARATACVCTHTGTCTCGYKWDSATVYGAESYLVRPAPNFGDGMGAGDHSQYHQQLTNATQTED